MALPTKDQVLSLDYVEWSLPFVPVNSKGTVVSTTLDYVEWSLPFVPGSQTITSNVYVNINGVWKSASKIYVKVSGVWKESADDIIYNKNNGTWYGD